ncbi:MAG: hypothetical protein O7A67_02925 [SAR324 cluster bacterium]|nr:hypothetical protein [SAR324 cluster bacterium]
MPRVRRDRRSAREWVKLSRYIESMTSVTTLVEAMHGAGSPQAQRIAMLRQADLQKKIEMAEKVIGGTDDVEGIPLKAPIPTP